MLELDKKEALLSEERDKVEKKEQALSKRLRKIAAEERVLRLASWDKKSFSAESSSLDCPGCLRCRIWTVLRTFSP